MPRGAAWLGTAAWSSGLPRCAPVWPLPLPGQTLLQGFSLEALAGQRRSVAVWLTLRCGRHCRRAGCTQSRPDQEEE